jgi:uncharacterized protein YkwD
MCLLALGCPRPGTAAPKPQIDLQELTKRIHELVNRERVDRDLPPLAWNGTLADIAREHSEDMRENQYLNHINPKGESPTDRGNRAGFRCRKKYDNFYEEGLAENLCRNSLFHTTKYTYADDGETREHLWNTLEELASSTVRSWMESKKHRDNILNPHHDNQGIGVAVAEDGKVYITELFC